MVIVAQPLFMLLLYCSAGNVAVSVCWVCCCGVGQLRVMSIWYPTRTVWARLIYAGVWVSVCVRGGGQELQVY